MASDAELVAASLGGDDKAFQEIISRYREAVFAVALSRLGNFHDAEDVAQEVFVAAHGRLGGLKGPARLGAWLRSIAINRALDAFRRRRETVGIDRVDDGAVRVWREDTRSTDLQNEVMARIAALGKAQRETTALFYINGYTINEVAAIQEVPPGTVKRRLHEARGRLKKEMMAMVENVLKSAVPADDFAQRVFQVLDRRKGEPQNPYAHERWNQTVAELRDIGARGFSGFARALQSPYSPTRVWAMSLLHYVGVARREEAAVELLKKLLADPNRKVRKWAAGALLMIDAKDERIRSEFLPLVVPLLRDPSVRVRRGVASSLVQWASDVPVEQIAAALLAETDRVARKWQKCLLHAATHGGEPKWFTE